LHNIRGEGATAWCLEKWKIKRDQKNWHAGRQYGKGVGERVFVRSGFNHTDAKGLSLRQRD
jgi:hypothetical protein